MPGGDDDLAPPAHEANINASLFAHFPPDSLVNGLAILDLAAGELIATGPGLVFAAGADEELVFPADYADGDEHFGFRGSIRHQSLLQKLGVNPAACQTLRPSSTSSIYLPYVFSTQSRTGFMIPIDLSGQVALVTGVSDNESFAWSIAKTLQ